MYTYRTYLVINNKKCKTIYSIYSILLSLSCISFFETILVQRLDI